MSSHRAADCVKPARIMTVRILLITPGPHSTCSCCPAAPTHRLDVHEPAQAVLPCAEQRKAQLRVKRVLRADLGQLLSGSSTQGAGQKRCGLQVEEKCRQGPRGAKGPRTGAGEEGWCRPGAPARAIPGIILIVLGCFCGKTCLRAVVLLIPSGSVGAGHVVSVERLFEASPAATATPASVTTSSSSGRLICVKGLERGDARAKAPPSSSAAHRNCVRSTALCEQSFKLCYYHLIDDALTSNTIQLSGSVARCSQEAFEATTCN